MKNIKQILTSEEIEEIEAFKEICKGMSVNGKPVKCFETLSKLINQDIDLNSIARNDLLEFYSQLKEATETLKNTVWFDSSVLEVIVPKVKKPRKRSFRP